MWEFLPFLNIITPFFLVGDKGGTKCEKRGKAEKPVAIFKAGNTCLSHFISNVTAEEKNF